jgi:hypothetical protein
MWSKMMLDLPDVAKICELKWNTPSSGCYVAPRDFISQSIQDFLHYGNNPNVPTLGLELVLAFTVDSEGLVWYFSPIESIVGKFLGRTFPPPPIIMRFAPACGVYFIFLGWHCSCN